MFLFCWYGNLYFRRNRDCYSCNGDNLKTRSLSIYPNINDYASHIRLYFLWQLHLLFLRWNNSWISSIGNPDSTSWRHSNFNSKRFVDHQYNYYLSSCFASSKYHYWELSIQRLAKVIQKTVDEEFDKNTTCHFYSCTFSMAYGNSW